MLKRASWVIALVSLCVLSLHDARAQADEKKFEVGGQFSLLRLPTRTVTDSGSALIFTEGRDTEYGFGGRFGYNFSKYFALEAEGNFFPRDRHVEGGRKIQGVFGVKAGKRFEKFGVFAKVRPGFIRFEKGDYVFVGGPAVFPPLLSSFRPVARTNFAVDLGGIVELYPSKRTIIRFDAGDTIIRLGARNVAAFQVNAPSPAFGSVVLPMFAQTTHNFQGSVGFGFRF
jgi:hypothetical protein